MSEELKTMRIGHTASTRKNILFSYPQAGFFFLAAKYRGKTFG
jgi:hypothetical protein